LVLARGPLEEVDAVPALERRHLDLVRRGRRTGLLAAPDARHQSDCGQSKWEPPTQSHPPLRSTARSIYLWDSLYRKNPLPNCTRFARTAAGRHSQGLRLFAGREGGDVPIEERILLRMHEDRRVRRAVRDARQAVVLDDHTLLLRIAERMAERVGDGD